MMTDEEQQEFDWLKWHYFQIQAYHREFADPDPAFVRRKKSFRQWLIDYYEGPYGNNGRKVPDKYKVPDWYYAPYGEQTESAQTARRKALGWIED